jgi:hypothetical protein
MNFRRILLFLFSMMFCLNVFAQKDTSAFMRKVMEANKIRLATDMTGSPLARNANNNLDPGIIYTGTPYIDYEIISSGTIPSKIKNGAFAIDFCAGTTITDEFHYNWDKSTDGGVNWTGFGAPSASTYQPPALTQTTYYRRVSWSWDALGCAIRYSISDPVYIFVQTPGFLNGGSIAAAISSICPNYGISINNTGSPLGGTLPLTYSWEQKTGTGNFTAIPNATGLSYLSPALTTTTTFRRKTTDATNLVSYSNEATVSLHVGAVATITNGATASGNCNVVLDAQTETGNTYQWQLKDINNNYQNINGATASTYTATQSGDYRVIVANNTCSASTATSNPVSVQVTTSQPLAQITNGSTASGNCSVVLNAATASGYTYQWQLKDNNNNYQNINGATASNYTATQSGDYKVVVTYATCGATSATSNPITVQVITTEPLALITNGSAASGSCIVVLSASTASGNTYQWQKRDINNNYSSINGATSSSYTVTQSGDYRVVVWSSVCGNTSSNSLPTIVTITSTPPGNPADFGNGNWKMYAYNGTNQNLGANVYRGYYDYAISFFNNIYEPAEYSRNESPSFLPANPVYSSTWHGCPVDVDNFTMVAKRMGFACGSYLIKIRVGRNEMYAVYLNGNLIGSGNNAASSGAFVVLTSTAVALNSNSLLEVRVNHFTDDLRFDFEVVQQNVGLTAGYIQPAAGQTINYNTVPITLTSSTDGTATNNALTYQWESAPTNSGPWTVIPNATAATYTSPALLQTTYFRRGALNGTCEGPKYTNNIQIEVVNIPANPALHAGSIAAASTSVCNNSIVTINNTSSALQGTAPYTYSWEQKTGTGSFTTIPNATNVSYTSAALTAATTFRRKVTDANNDIAYSNEVTISILPNAIAIITNGTTASGICSVVLNAQTASGYTYQWQKRDIYNNYSSISGATGSSYTAAESGDYRVVVWGNTCDNVGTNSLPTIVTLTSAPPGNPADFGNGNWRVYSYNGIDQNLDANVYRGYYDYALSFFNNIYEPAEFTRSQSPSYLPVTPIYSSPWHGCSVDVDNFTMVAKRRGFTCGSYQVRIRVGSNEMYAVYLNGNLIGSGGNSSGSTSFVVLSNTALDANSTIEARVKHFTGQLRFDFEVEQLNPTLTGGFVQPGAAQTITYNTAPIAFTSSTDGNSTNGPLTYQWEKAPTNTGPWTVIPNATNAGYSSPVLLQTTYFRRGAINGTCEGPKYTNNIQVNVTNIPVLPLAGGSIAAASTNICSNGNTSINSTVDASGGTAALVYAWEKKTGTSPFSTIAQETSSTLTITNLTVTSTFRRKVTDATGNTLYSNEITVNVLLAGSIAPATQSIYAGNAPAQITSAELASGHSSTITYQWQNGTSASGSWNNMANETNATLQPGILHQNTYYRRLALTSGCTAGVASNISQVLVEMQAAQPLNAGVLLTTAPQCINAGSTPPEIYATAVSGGVPPYSYQWQKNDNGTWVDYYLGISQSFQPPALASTTSFRRMVYDASNNIAYTNIITFKIQSGTLNAGIIDGPQVTCSGTASNLTNVLTACGGAAFVYSWEKNEGNGSWTTINNATAETYNALSVPVSTKYRRKVSDAYCSNEAYSNTVEVLVYPTIEAGTIYPDNQTVCIDQPRHPLALMQECHYTNGTVTYQWQQSIDWTATWTDIPNATNATYLPTMAYVSAYYRLKISSTTCSAVAYSNPAVVYISGCWGTAKTATATAPAIIASTTVKAGMKVYPNPAVQGQSVTVVIEGAEGNLKAILKGTDGRTYNCTVSSSSKGVLQVKLPSPMAKGIYLVQVSNNKQQWIEKILVQ